jgi:ABC-type uncharacterized transport system substrate-binding protein
MTTPRLAGLAVLTLGCLIAPYPAGGQPSGSVQRVGIMTGIQPRDLPVENYDRIELTLNLRTAREIGLTIPPSVRDRADHVIE